MNLDKNLELVKSLNEKDSVNFKPPNWPGLNILGQLSYQMSFASILGNLPLQVTIWCAHSVKVRCFLCMCGENPGVYSLEFGGTRVG